MADVSRGPEEPAHDILAAEAFAVPAPDPALRRSLVLPEDPLGLAEPHDVLAAEEFAMPAPAPEHRWSGGGRSAAGSSPLPSWAWIAAAGLAGLWVRRRSGR